MIQAKTDPITLFSRSIVMGSFHISNVFRNIQDSTMFSVPLCTLHVPDSFVGSHIPAMKVVLDSLTHQTAHAPSAGYPDVHTVPLEAFVPVFGFLQPFFSVPLRIVSSGHTLLCFLPSTSYLSIPFLIHYITSMRRLSKKYLCAASSIKHFAFLSTLHNPIGSAVIQWGYCISYFIRFSILFHPSNRYRVCPYRCRRNRSYHPICENAGM